MAALDPRVESALKRWSEAHLRGTSLTVEELCTDCPDLVDVVRAHLQLMESMEDYHSTHVPERRGEPVGEHFEPNGGPGDFSEPSVPEQTKVVPHVGQGPTEIRGEFSTLPDGDDDDGPGNNEAFGFALNFADLEPHARGGLGEVFVARDGNTRRRIALKTIRPEYANEPEVAERLLLEAEVTARLEHPGVVPVHGLGRSSNGRPFYVMQFVEGRTLDEAIREHYRPENRHAGRHGSVEFHTLLNHFVSVCKTIAYAHNRGIIHRDIKPHNVLLGRFGETVVADWGLATPVRREAWARASGERTLAVGSNPSGSGADSKSSSGSGAGTPVFMSPEQASLSENIGPASDVYNLGATLYKIATGNNPVGGGSVQSIMDRVARGEIDPPARHNRHLSKALEAICRKAMALEPRDRYRTALDLADDVEKFLADDAVSAYADPWGRRVARWARQHRTATQSMLLVLLFVMVGGLSAAWVFGQHAVREGELHAAASAAAQREHDLRERTLRTSAEFAARGLANQVDVRWRILEREAAHPRVAEWLADINEQPDDEVALDALQAWLDLRGENYAEHVPNRALFVNSLDGTQVARFPSHDENGERFRSLRGGRYAFRDYFHGRGEDLQRDQSAPPFEEDVHLSAVHESTNDGDLSVVFGTPIRDPESGRSIGILSMSVSIGEFADLDVTLPPGQSVLLIDTKQYSMHRRYPTPHEEWCEGLVLHHESMGELRSRARLPRVQEFVLERLQSDASADNLLPRDYRDPLAAEERIEWLAASAPVRVENRPATLRETGWFVIVQQEQPE